MNYRKFDIVFAVTLPPTKIKYESDRTNYDKNIVAKLVTVIYFDHLGAIVLVS